MSMRLAADVTNNRHLRWILCLALLATAGIASAGWTADESNLVRRSPVAADGSSVDLAITALGRVQPKDGVLTIAAPASDAGAAIVAALHVRQGDWVEPGHVLATLRGRVELEAVLTGRQRKMAIARARLGALQSGGKEDDLQALRSEVQSDEATLANVAAETRRAAQLHEHGLLPTADLQAQRSRLVVAVRALDAKRSRLSGLSSVRPADVAVAQAELRAADAEVEEVRARLENTVVRAPCAGRVLAVYAQPGQSVGAEGLLAFGKTADMFVDAEVLEEDLARVRVGQKARITGAMLTGEVAGTVEEIGWLVGSREVFTTDPTAFADSRVVHVKIRAAQPDGLARFINAKVTAEIQP